MSVRDVTAAVPEQRFREAFEHGEWACAADLLQAEREQRELSSDELDLLARAAYACGRFECAVATWEQAYAEQSLVRDDAGAAVTAATIALHLMMDTGLMAPVRGWLARAQRLLDGQPDGAAHALVAAARTYERFLCGDTTGAQQWAEQAVALGVQHAVTTAAALGRVAAARIVILDGQVEHGLALLDEAAVSVVSGELDALGAGMVYCELICAMQGLAQYDRAEQWTHAMDSWRQGRAFGGIHGRCRVHRAEILRLRGECAEAEREALDACRELRPWMRREFGWPLTELGTIRLRRGDLAGAQEAFLEAHEAGWDPQPGLALLRLAGGDVPAASALIAGALEHPARVPSKERPPHNRLRRAPLLDAQVEIALAAGDVATAAAAAAELSAIADTYRSSALLAAAWLARGRVALAEQDAQRAVDACQQAVAGWSEVGAPYEAALSRLVLAQAHRALGAEGQAQLASASACAVLERIGAVPPPQPPRPAPPRQQRAGNVFRHDGSTRSVVFDGRAVVLCDLKGMRYLARLLAEPGRELHALDLVTGECHDSLSRSPADTGPILDEQARAAYKRRLVEIEQDIDEATALGDAERVALAEADREYLVRELARAFGISGRPRPTDRAERARVSVTRAVRYAMVRIAEHHPPLAEHLELTIRTGTYCAYRPDPRVPAAWEL